MILNRETQQHPFAWWQSNNPILLKGQMGYITDMATHKIGDGCTTFALLPFGGIPLIGNWIAQFKPIQNSGNLLSTLYNNALIGGSLVALGNWADFEYIFTIANNSNAKTIWIKFANQIIYTLTGGIGPLSNLTLRLKGKVTSIDYINKKISYWVEKLDNNGAVTLIYGVLSGIDLSQNNHLLLQGQGIADNDIIAEQGMGAYCAISLPNSII